MYSHHKNVQICVIYKNCLNNPQYLLESSEQHHSGIYLPNTTIQHGDSLHGQCWTNQIFRGSLKKIKWSPRLAKGIVEGISGIGRLTYKHSN